MNTHHKHPGRDKSQLHRPLARYPSHAGYISLSSARVRHLVMPLLPSGTRRKRITPLANLHEDDVWLRTFKLFGLEPLTPYPVSHTDLVLSTYQSEARKGSVSTMEAAVSTNGVADVKKESRIGFLDLPAETQSEVFKNVSCRVRGVIATLCYRFVFAMRFSEDSFSNSDAIVGTQLTFSSSLCHLCS